MESRFALRNRFIPKASYGTDTIVTGVLPTRNLVVIDPPWPGMAVRKFWIPLKNSPDKPG